MRAAIASLLFLAACETTPPPGGDAGPSGDARAGDDAANPTCDVDRACPESAPVWGGPCEGTLSCAFPSQCMGKDDLYECVSSEWSLTMPAPCLGGGPPLAESCRDPSTGTIADARLSITADRAGAPELADGDTIEIAFGAQGLAMVPYRVHVDGTDVPSCVRVTATVSLESMSAAPAIHPVRLRCGSSLRIQDILPELPCDSRPYAIGIDVTVDGAGTLHRDLTAIGGGCPLAGG